MFVRFNAIRRLVFFPALIVLAVVQLRADESASPTAPEGPRYALRYKFQPGEIVRMKVLHRANSETTISGTTQTAETTSGSVKVWRIQAAEPDGHTTFEHLVESVDMRQKISGHQEITYNSQTDKEPPPVYAVVAKDIGVPLATVTIDRSGKILKRIDKRSNAPTDSQNSDMVVPLPGEEVAVGANWNVPQEITVNLEGGESKVIKLRQHYTLDKVANGVATISITTQVLTPVSNPKIQSQLSQRLTQGTIRFDIDAGRVLSKQLELDERVLGFQGPESSVHFIGQFREEYLPPETKTAAKVQTKK